MACPDHRPVSCEGGTVCLTCEKFYPNGQETYPRIPAKGRRVSQKRPQRQSEAELVTDIVKALRLCGRTVLRCGQWRADKAGSTAGTPDLFVACRSWEAAWFGLEVKTQTGRLSPAQKQLAEEGKTYVVRSVDEALEAVGETIHEDL